jgi:hypothetical protein
MSAELSKLKVQHSAFDIGESSQNGFRYFKDNLTIEQIHKDVQRLCPEFAFFQGETFLPRSVALPPHRALAPF